MSDDALDPVLTAALVAGAGVAGYVGARWFSRDPSSATDTATAAPAGATSFASTPIDVRPTPSRPRPRVRPVASPAPARPPAPRHPAAPLSGPVTSPEQVDQPTDQPARSPRDVESEGSAASSSAALPRRLDPIFERHRGDIPVEYLRALAMRESSMNPAERGRAGWGLFQIIEVVRADFNRAHRTSYTRPQLLDADVNTRIATWLLRFIVDGYHRHHPDVPNLRPDWTNPRFAELVTFGWVAGPSETGGVGRVVSYLVGKGARDVDLALVHDQARTAGASKHLSDPAKVRWCRGVVALYLRERARAAGPVTTPVA